MFRPFSLLFWVCMIFGLTLCSVHGSDLSSVIERGTLRHLGVPYANFVTGSGDGLDVEIIQLFAKELGVAYQFVPTTWETAIGDLTGKDIISGKDIPTQGDILASGVSILEWRKQKVDFTVSTFLSQVWLIARADVPISPIIPGKNQSADILKVRSLIKGQEVMGVAHTCLDPDLYGLVQEGAKVKYFKGRLNELAPAVINQVVGLSLMEVPDVLVALEKWPGQIKVIGPVSSPQPMGAAIAKSSPELKQAFNRFFTGIKEDGTYQALVEKYYPGFPGIFPGYFKTDH